jgi:LysM repeat protein
MFRWILLIILLALLAAMGVGGWFLADKFLFAPQRAEAAEKAELAQPPPEDPSRAVWRELLGRLNPADPASDLQEIRSFLAEHPQSEVRGEAFDLLSRRGAHWLFSNIPAPWKETHRVVSGDAMARISSRQGVSAEWIMQVNNLLDYNLRIGQELLLPKPDLRLIASRAEGRLFVLNGEEILLAYPLTFSQIPDSAVGESSVREKIASSGGARHAFGSPAFVGAEKSIPLTNNLNLRALPEGGLEAVGAGLPAGLLLSAPDLEEVFLLVKRGTPVIIE